MASAGSLIFELAADVSHLRTDMAKAQTEMQSALDAIAKSSATTALLTGADFAMKFAKGFSDQITAAIDQGDALGKLAQRIGTTTEELSGLQYAGSFAGVGVDDLTAGMKGLNKSLLDARDPLSDAAAAYKSFGLNVKELQGMDPSAAFDKIADSVTKYADGAQKAAAVQTIFGKSAQVLIPLLNEGADGIAAARKEAEDLGLVVSTQTAQSMADLNDDFSRLKNISTGLAMQVAGELVPSLQELTRIIKDSKESGNTWNLMFQGITITAQGVVTTLIGMAGTVVTLGKFVMTVARTLDAPLGEIKKTWTEGIAGAQASMQETMDTMGRTMHIRSEQEKKDAASGAEAQRQLEAAMGNTGKAANDYTGKLDANAKAHQRAKKDVDEFKKMLESIDEQYRKLAAEGDPMKELTTDPKFLAMGKEQQAILVARTQANIDLKLAIDARKQAEENAYNADVTASKAAAAAWKAEEDHGNKMYEWGQQLNKTIDPMIQYTESVRDLNDAMKEGAFTPEQYNEHLKNFQTQLKQAQADLDPNRERIEAFSDAIQDWGRQSADAFTDFATGADTLANSFRKLVAQMLTDLAKLIVYQYVLKGLFSGVSSWAGGLAGGVSAVTGGGGVSAAMQSVPVTAPAMLGAYSTGGGGGSTGGGSNAGGVSNPAVNVNVHVHKDNREEEATTADTKQAADLGQRIAAAVRQVITTEKRAGGLLAPTR